MIKICIDILLAVGEKGGVENVINKNAVYLQQQGFQVRVVQLVWEGVHWVSESIPFYPLLNGRGNYTLNQFVTHYSDFLRTHEKPDIILAAAWPMMILVARMSAAKLNWRCKIVSWLHAPIDKYVAAGYGGMECLAKADEIFVLNEKTKNIIHTHNPALRTTLVTNPVDFTKCNIRFNSSWKCKTLLFVGRLSVEKRIDVILRAIRLAQSTWRLVLVGDGDERSRLEELTDVLQLKEQVHFIGWKTNPWEYITEASALIMASEYECFPMSAIESLACGIPVISTPVDGIIELIKPGINGFLFPSNDSSGLAQLLDNLATGKIPSIAPEVCRETVSDYEEQRVLSDFSEKLHHVLDKISVIIPCYNVEKQIERCLDSILNQSLHGVELEIICIDDKSTDNTLQLLRHYENKYPETFLLVELEENQKQGYGRNIGMHYASGSYITFVDADDAIAPQMLSRLYEEATASGCDVAECAYKEIHGSASLSVSDSGSPEYMDMRNPSARKQYILQYGWKTAPWGRLYKSDFLRKNQICFLTDTYMEDIYFSEHCMLVMNTYVRIPQTYYFYCINESGVMFGGHIINNYMDTAKVQNITTKAVTEQSLIKDCRNEYAYLHFSKAFAEPVQRMYRDKRFFSHANFLKLKEDLLRFFPDILENPYIANDNSAEMNLYKQLLREDCPEILLSGMSYFNENPQ